MKLSSMMESRLLRLRNKQRQEDKQRKRPQIVRSTSKLLKAMQIGEQRVFSERPNKNVGAPTQSCAVRASVKVKTMKCYIVVPKTDECFAAVLVTRTE